MSNLNLRPLDLGPCSSVEGIARILSCSPRLEILSLRKLQPESSNDNLPVQKTLAHMSSLVSPCLDRIPKPILSYILATDKTDRLHFRRTGGPFKWYLRTGSRHTDACLMGPLTLFACGRGGAEIFAAYSGSFKCQPEHSRSDSRERTSTIRSTL